MLFINSQKKNPVVKFEELGGQGMVPLFLPNDQETPCPEKHEHDGRWVVYHLTVKLFPQGHDAKQCFPSQPEKCHQSLYVLQKNKVLITFSSQRAAH
jgi:hypothetical protein